MDRLVHLEERLARLENRLARLEAMLNRLSFDSTSIEPRDLPAASPAEPEPEILTPASPPRAPGAYIQEPAEPAESAEPAEPAGSAGSAAASPPSAPVRPVESTDLEQRIGRVWLPRIAMACVSLAVLFIIISAYGSLGPAVRLGLGYLGGILLAAAGWWGERKNYRYLAAGLTAAAAVTGYLCTYAGYDWLDLFGRLPAFAVMALITAGTLLAAFHFNQPSVAFMGLTGGFITPTLLGLAVGDAGSLWSLLSYLAVLDLGLLGLAHYRRWPLISVLGFLATQFYLFAYWREILAGSSVLALAPAALFFVIFSALSFYRHILRARASDDFDLALSIFNGLALFAWVLAVFYRHDPLWHWPGAGALAVAAVQAGLGVGVYFRGRRDRPLLLCHFGLALAFATAAVPLQLEGDPVAFAWLAEAVFLVWLSRRLLNTALRRAGLFVYSLAFLAVFMLTADFMVGYAGARIWFPHQLLPLSGLTIGSWLMYLLYKKGIPGIGAASTQGFAILASILFTVLVSCQWWLGLNPRPHADRSWLQLGFFLFWAVEAVFLMWWRQPGQKAGKLAATVILFSLAYKVFINAVAHYLPLERSAHWFDGYLWQGLGAFGLALFTGRCWPTLDRKKTARNAGVIAAVGFFVFLTLEYLTLPIYWVDYARGLGLSALWTIYAASLIMLGLRHRRRTLRLLGLIFFGAALGKLFLFDLHWTGLYRAFSFLGAGVVAYVLAALYQKWGRAEPDQELKIESQE